MLMIHFMTIFYQCVFRVSESSFCDYDFFLIMNNCFYAFFLLIMNNCDYEFVSHNPTALQPTLDDTHVYRTVTYSQIKWWIQVQVV